MNKPLLSLLFAALCTGSVSLSAQLNMSLVSNLDYADVLNDIWGWVDSTGNEYALVGTTEGFSIVDIREPSQPEEVAFVPGQSTVWRDIKTWGNFAYVVSDNTSEGMLIVDLSTIGNDSLEYVYWDEQVDNFGRLLRSHNIYIDEYGLAYLSGSNLGGVVVLDVKPDPWDPTFVVRTNSPYAHDAYARDSLVYSAEIYMGEFAVYDISRPEQVQRLGSAKTPFEFTHNLWLSDDSKTIFTTDERADAFVGSYDVSDFDNIRELDRYRPAATEGLGVIPHNVHVWDDYLIISYYTDGCIVVDASRPDNLVEVGNFDTFFNTPENASSFSGAWGAYPFLPSGLVLVSDRQNGLFVLEPNYVRGCYLEALCVDNETGQPILNARVEIPGEEVITPDFTDLTGRVKMGKAVPGNHIVRATHPEYFPRGVEVEFTNGEQSDVTLRLTKRPTYKVNGAVVDSRTGEMVPNANVILSDDFFNFSAETDSSGQYALEGVFEGTYRVYAGTFDRYMISEVTVDGEVDEVFEVDRGIYDDFNFDYGWQVTGTSTVAMWQKDVPILETYRGAECNPGTDIRDDFGEEAFVTGNLGGNAENNSVEGGFTLLTSPVMDLSEWEAPVVAYRSWLCVRFVSQQAYFVLATNGQDTVTIDTIQPDGTGGYWRDRVEVPLPDSFQLTEQVQIHFMAVNENDENVVKAALDVFEVFDAMSTSSRDLTKQDEIQVNIFPNPGSMEVNITLDSAPIDGTPDEVRLYDMLGNTVLAKNLPQEWTTEQVSHSLPSGLYILTLLRDGKQVYSAKYIVH